MMYNKSIARTHKQLNNITTFDSYMKWALSTELGMGILYPEHNPELLSA